MTVTIDATGLTVPTYEELVEDLISTIGTGLSLTEADKSRIRANVQSTLGVICRAQAEALDVAMQALYECYAMYGPMATGPALDGFFGSLGIFREPAEKAFVTGDFIGTPSTSIPTGTKLRYPPNGTIWEVVDGPFVIGGGGTVEGTIQALVAQEDVVAVDPSTGFDSWEYVDTVAGADSFESTEQTIRGQAIETDAAYRQRALDSIGRKGEGTLTAIKGQLQDVTGLEYVEVYHNPTDTLDVSSGLPAHSVNVVYDGGSFNDVATIIQQIRAYGIPLYAEPGPTFQSTVINGETIIANTVEDIPIYVRATLTTSTSEEDAPADLEAYTKTEINTLANSLFGIGDDVTPHRLVGVYKEVPGIDVVVIEVSDDGSSWSTAKYPISIRQRATFSETNISLVEV